MKDFPIVSHPVVSMGGMLPVVVGAEAVLNAAAWLAGDGMFASQVWVVISLAHEVAIARGRRS